MSEIPSELQEALKGRYEIVRELGRGGMAVVYLARDLKLNREVAIKVLIPDLAMAMGPERFNREIEIAGHLSHPHILPVYDSGNAEGRLYYVMPYVAGESLRARLDREKQLPIAEALRLSIEVARALDYAHKQGVVHRDIKPENILLEGGNAVVADFGIARAVSSMAEGQALTQTGMTLGTAAYMSPEQVAAEKHIDGRSDIYSLACVTYEMLAGHPPFTGPTAVAVMARQAMEMPPSMTVVRNTIPEEVEETVFQALAKSPVDRFENSGEFADALQECLELSPRITRRHPQMRMTQSSMARRRQRRRKSIIVASAAGAALIAALIVAWRVITDGASAASAATSGLDRKSIAVLYFDDLSRDSSLGHIADALTEGLISELSSSRALNVASRNASAQFRDTRTPPDSIATALGTGTLVHGNVDLDGSDLRVTTWLINGSSGADMDRRTFKLPASRLITVRDSVVREVAELLRRSLGEDVRVTQSRAGTTNVDAWALVQRAERLRKEAITYRDRGDLDAATATYLIADSLLTIAESADQKWPEPVTLRGQVAYERASTERDLAKREALLDTVVAKASHALTLQRDYAPALSLRGRVYRTLYVLNVSPDPATRARLLDSAKADLEAAVRADATQAEALFALSQVHYDRKDNFSALIAARQAYEADAFLRNQHINLRQLFWTHYDLQQFPDAERWCREGARRFPQNYLFAECQLWLMITPGKKPDIARAWTLAGEAEKLAPAGRRPFEAQLGRLIVAGALARAEMADSARNVLKSLQLSPDVDPEQDLVGYSAIVHIILGDHAEAIELLKNYVVTHPTHEFTVGGDLHWWWRPLQDKPGFQAIVGRRAPSN